MVKVLAEWARMFSRSMPKYMLSAPARRAAANDSGEPTGAMISYLPLSPPKEGEEWSILLLISCSIPIYYIYLYVGISSPR